MKNRIYSIPAYGARETGGNPVMPPEVTMELVKRITSKASKQELSKILGWMICLYGLCVGFSMLGITLNSFSFFKEPNILNLMGWIACVIGLYYSIRSLNSLKPEVKISVPPLG